VGPTPYFRGNPSDLLPRIDTFGGSNLDYATRIRERMPVHRSVISKLFAVWLIILSVSPFTLPFSIADLIDVLNHNDPMSEHVGCDALVKAKTATAPTPSEQADSNVLSPSITLVTTQQVAYDGPPQRLGLVHRILRL
jgi:hypothetical protein